MHHFSQLLQALAGAKLEFVIVGGYAGTTHGSAYVTRDIDVCAVLTQEAIAKLRSALAGWTPEHRMTPQRLSFMTNPPAGVLVHTLNLQTELGVSDVLPEVLGVGDFERLQSQAEELQVDGRRYRVMSLEDLIQAKEALGREKDLLTAKELREIAAKRKRG